MNRFQDWCELPEHLVERTRALSTTHSELRGHFILYWMHHAVRSHENPALDVAVLTAHQLNLPLLVYQGLSGKHKFNSDRHHTFIMQGARDVQQQLKERGIRYAFYLSQSPSERSPLFALASQATVLITEDFPAPPFPDWIRNLALTIDTPVWTVDTSCILPMQKVGKFYSRAFAFRSNVLEEMQYRAQLEWPTIDSPPTFFSHKLDFDDVNFEQESINDLCAQCFIDHSVGPIHHTPGGSQAGYQRWNLFKEHGLSTYHKTRNNAAISSPKGVSRMSAYLHHGHVSPFKLAREAAQYKSEGSKKYLDELLIWRELAFNLCFHHQNVESVEILPPWAQSTLLAHSTDHRPKWYSMEILERGETDDELWNAAQKSLLIHGELHNNVRMTWGKALLQWTHSPQHALEVMIDLNHRYALDGSDPNSYGGLLWCLGLFDRPFTPEAPIYGAVRTRPTNHHRKRINMQSYNAKILKSPRSAPLQVAIIGAGIAGLSAARCLINNGAEVKLFEKSRGPGGRMATRRVDNFAFDHGAQYFTVRDERFHSQVSSWLQEGIVQQWQGKIGAVSKGIYEERTVSTARYVGAPRMSAVTRRMASGLDILYNTRILKTSYHAGHWHLNTENQEEFGRFDALVITTPPPQALPFLDSSPSLLEQIKQVNMQPCWAVMASFNTSLAIPFDGIFIKDNPLSWASRNNSKPGRPEAESWILHASPDWSTVHLESDADHILERLLSAFEEATGQEIPKPIFAKAHRWRYALAKNPIEVECLWDGEKNRAVCGDWCNNSRVEGAYLSGVAAAGRIAGIPDETPKTMQDVQLSFPGL